MGRVYLAHDRLLERAVALKFAVDLAGDARERFLLEARAAARIQHPNVATMYRVGEYGGWPYLVTEYVRGRSLADLTLPLPWRRALEIGIGLARGLAAAHRHGVLHRDIKLANAIISDRGELKLIDFGLAKLEAVSPPEESAAAAAAARGARPLLESFGRSEDPSSAVVGTPNYMAPELWRSEPATRRTDVYALGVLLYVLCCNQAPTAAKDTSELAVRVQCLDPVPLRDRAPDVDPRLAAIIDRCIRRNPAERLASGEALRVALEALQSISHEGAAPGGNPYRGLRAFEAEHRDLFFGRSSEILTIVDRLRGQPFVLVVGDSGVGKSSLCRAGVLPVLCEGVLEQSRTWVTLSLTPGRRPVHAIVEALARSLGMSEQSLLTQVRAEPDALEQALRRQQSGSRGRVIFVDQLEELVTLANPVEASLAARLLAQLASGITGVRLLATARGDFLTRLAQQPGLGAELASALLFIGPLTPEGMRQAIVGPAAARQVRFESEAMIDHLVTAGLEGSLPLLQFALAEVWEARDVTTDVITAVALEQIGGVSGALARHADGTLARLNVTQRKAARMVLLRLVTLDMTRASLPAEELTGEDPAARAALEALVKARLVVVREQAEGFVHEIAHEALIQGWATLQVWLDEEAESRVVRRRLEVASTDWERLGQPRDGLWSERQLAELRHIDPSVLRPRETTFIAASEAHARRRRRARGVAAAAVPVLLLLGYAGFRIAENAARAREVGAHLVAAGELSTSAARRDRELQEMRRAAFSDFDAGRRPEAEAIWRRVRADEPALSSLHARAVHELELALGVDPRRRDVHAALADALLARAISSERAGDDALVADLLSRLELHDDDGERRARWSAPARVDLTTTPEGARVWLERYDRQADGAIHPGNIRELGTTPLRGIELPPGSYRLSVQASGRREVRAPLLLRRGESLTLELPLPERTAIPPGFVYVPAGRFLFGSAGDEDLRQGFYGTVPLHEVTTGAYLIATHETTYGEWIAFLEAQPREQQHLGGAGEQAAFQAAPALTRRGDGIWQLGVQVGGERRTLAFGEPLIRAKRTRRVEQDWLRLPVTGINWDEGLRYVAWLSQTGRVPGARFCTEYEWERAARGADGRRFPGGEVLGPDDANFDETYLRDPEAMGPDEVGAHPGSESPFGIQDLAGNVYEWTEGVLAPEERVARGGAYFFGALSARAMNRNIVAPEFRDGTVGLRVCATPTP